MVYASRALCIQHSTVGGDGRCRALLWRNGYALRCSGWQIPSRSIIYLRRPLGCARFVPRLDPSALCCPESCTGTAPSSCQAPTPQNLDRFPCGNKDSTALSELPSVVTRPDQVDGMLRYLHPAILFCETAGQNRIHLLECVYAFIQRGKHEESGQEDTQDIR
jgi:hypothetical protein